VAELYPYNDCCHGDMRVQAEVHSAEFFEERRLESILFGRVVACFKISRLKSYRSQIHQIHSDDPLDVTQVIHDTGEREPLLILSGLS